MIFVNVVLTIFSLLFSTIIIYHVIIPSGKDKKKFRLFKLRDDLCTLVMEGKVDEHSDEFKFMMKLILGTIKTYSGNFMKVSQFFRICIEPDLAVLKEVKIIRKKIVENEDMKPILNNYDFFVDDILKRYLFALKLIRIFLFPLAMLALFLLKNNNYSIKKKMNNRVKSIEKYQNAIMHAI